LLTEPEEIDLIKLLASFPEEIKEAAKDYDPSQITRYSIEVAALFHKFYNACRVKNDNAELMNARLILCNSVRTVLKNCLDLLKVSSPEKM
jgi:arginyl-tRNA synthetase